MVRLIKASLRLFVGVLFGVGTAVALSPLLAVFTGTEADESLPIVTLGIVLLSGILCVLAPSMRRAFGRGFLLIGTSIFLLPISTFVLSGHVASEVVDAAENGSEAAAIVGAGIAATAMTGLATFFGLILGSVFLLIGVVLCLGGTRKVQITD